MDNLCLKKHSRNLRHCLRTLEYQYFIKHKATLKISSYIHALKATDQGPPAEVSELLAVLERPGVLLRRCATAASAREDPARMAVCSSSNIINRQQSPFGRLGPASPTKCLGAQMEKKKKEKKTMEPDAKQNSNPISSVLFSCRAHHSINSAQLLISTGPLASAILFPS